MPVGWTGWREQSSWELSRGTGDYFVTGTGWHSTICLSVGGGEGWLSSISSPPKCNLFFHWEEDSFSASSAKVTGSCVLYGDIPLGSRAASTRVTPLALPGWFTIPGIVVALFGPSGNRDGKVQISSGTGSWAGSAHHSTEICCDLVLSVLMCAVVCTVWRQVPAWHCHGSQSLPWWIWPGANGLHGESLCHKHCLVSCCCSCLKPYCTLPKDPGFALGNT